VTAAVIQRDGKVLLAQRPTKSLLGGMWEFPGGTLEKGDADLEACLKREIMEELGVTIHVGAPFGKYKHAAFLCDMADDEQPQNLVSDRLEWVRFQDLSTYPMGKVDRQIAKQLLKEGQNEILPD